MIDLLDKLLFFGIDNKKRSRRNLKAIAAKSQLYTRIAALQRSVDELRQQVEALNAQLVRKQDVTYVNRD